MNLAILISLIAVTISVASLLYERNARRREMLLRGLQDFLSIDRQRGRRLLFELRDSGVELETVSPQDLDAINHALTSLDLLGYLYVRRYVPRRDAIQLWGATVVLAWRAGERTGFISWREGHYGATVWPFFRRLAVDADRKLTVSAQAALNGEKRCGGRRGQSTSP